MKIGSLFDGSGGFPLAAVMCGIEPVWAAEVEPYPIAVTRSRFPHMIHLGDVSKVDGGKVEPVNIITFGSPCQDLSVAGQRKGLKHEGNGDEETTRSGLFMEAVRIIKEMREATNGRYPNVAVWENVPGAFSSNRGEDFRTVLQELIKIVEPTAVMPAVPKGGWAYADCFVGEGWSLAWRVLDAQHWGVPQRRRRIFLALHLTGERAAEILFEREGLRGHFETGRTPWKTAAGDIEGSTGANDREGEGVAYSFYPQMKAESVTFTEEISVCLVVGTNPGFQNGVVYDTRGNGDGKVVPTITGDHENRITDYTSAVVESKVYESHPMDSRIKELDEVCPTVSVKWHKGAADTPLVCEKFPVYCLQGNGIDRADTAGCNGRVWSDKACYTLNTIDRPAVAYGIGNGQANQAYLHNVIGALNCMHDQQSVLVEANAPAYTLKIRSGCEGGGAKEP